MSGALGDRRRGFLQALARHLGPIKAIGLPCVALAKMCQ
jgi:hypothetical protein